MNLLHPLATFVQRSVDRSGYCQRTTNDSAHTDQETRKALAPGFAIYDLHGRDVL